MIDASDEARWKRLDARHHDVEAERYDVLVGREFAVYQARFTAGRWARRLAERGAGLVVDVGCGTGRTALDVAAEGRGLKVIGVDMSRGMLRKARAKAARRGLTGILWVMGDAERLPLADRVADGIVCQGVLHHLPDIEGAIAEFDRIATERAVIFLAEPDAEASAVYRVLRGAAALVARAMRGARRLSSPGAENERPLRPADVADPLRARGWRVRPTYLVHAPVIYRYVPLPIARAAVAALNRGDLSRRRRADIMIIDAERAESAERPSPHDRA